MHQGLLLPKVGQVHNTCPRPGRPDGQRQPREQGSLRQPTTLCPTLPDQPQETQQKVDSTEPYIASVENFFNSAELEIIVSGTTERPESSCPDAQDG